GSAEDTKGGQLLSHERSGVHATFQPNIGRSAHSPTKRRYRAAICSTISRLSLVSWKPNHAWVSVCCSKPARAWVVLYSSTCWWMPPREAEWAERCGKSRHLMSNTRRLRPSSTGASGHHRRVIGSLSGGAPGTTLNRQAHR